MRSKYIGTFVAASLSSADLPSDAFWQAFIMIVVSEIGA